jgi:23S rRNA (guanosine2251-2'-O)-methyltransferase
VSREREWLGGRNVATEVLRAGRRRVHRLCVLRTAERRGTLEQLLKASAAASIPVEQLDRLDLDRLSAHHQGVVVEVEGYPYVTLEEILQEAVRRQDPLFVLLLDMIQDPQNLGSLLRSGEAVGIHGVVIPSHRSAGITEAVVRASAGACEHMLVAQGNLVQAIQTIQRQGGWVYGLEAGPQAVPLGQVRLDGALGLVVGNEGEGMRKLVRRACDQLVQLPMRGRIGSLNAAVAGSVALYAVRAAREKTGRD